MDKKRDSLNANLVLFFYQQVFSERGENVAIIKIFSHFGIFMQYGRGISVLFRLDNRQVARKHP